MELSVVLVILGVLTGGILAGTRMIKSAELNSTITDISAHVVAYNAFKLRYRCTPGDCAHTEDFFTENVENGDGNGFINCKTGDGASCDAPTNEHVMAIRTLQQAGLIKGNSDITLTIVPTALRECELQFYQGNYYDGRTVNYLRVFNRLTAAPWNADCMTPEEAYSIDFKLDDGNPSKTKVLGLRFAGNPQSPCTSTNHWDPPSASAEYNIANEAENCSLFINF